MKPYVGIFVKRGKLICAWIYPVHYINASLAAIICKNNMNRFFPVVLEENLIFQKLTNQENILLNIIDYLKKNYNLKSIN